MASGRCASITRCFTAPTWPRCTGEAADVLYHLLVLLKAADITLDEVMAELERRTGQSGLEEKAARTR